MVEYRVVGDTRNGETVYWLEGVFDSRAAAELERAIAHRARPLTVDFSRVSRFVDYGLASFAERVVAQRRSEPPVTLAGLGVHHRRLLHYFGIEVASAPYPAADPVQPEDGESDGIEGSRALDRAPVGLRPAVI